MSPDYQGLHVLKAFLDSISLSDIPNTTDDNRTAPKHNPIPNENKLSCRICDISAFVTLEEFKLHRQTTEHLNKLTGTLNISSQENNSDSEENDNIPTKGSPYFEINYKGRKLQCYKILLANRNNDVYLKISLNLDLDLFRKLQNIQNSCFVVSLNGGGYFAAAIFDNSTRQLVCSKTIRKYTTRRKQGGSQSLKDNESSGKIHSAGSMIRRGNEKKLRDEILNLMTVWRPYLAKCSVVFCNRDIFLTQEVFKDLEVRNIPFTTYQADFEEICRCYTELISSIKVLD